ncbi:MAG: hypothetical protein IK058_01215 [Bacteroidales bacterium]|nr:hypothetical protein [Bacteroidales bacterium]
MKRSVFILFTLLCLSTVAEAQKLIEYTAGMGSRDPGNGDIWILYRHVRAKHEGMVLEADSAHYNTRENSFKAFRNVVIRISDTTFIFGDRLHYDGNTRVVDIWADTVVLVDGGTHLLANHITYERNRATSYYTEWGYGSSGDHRLFSREGQYNSDLKQFYIYSDVTLTDSTMRLVTDTLLYNTETSVAHFESPTHIYSDSSTIYSEMGDYNTDTRFAISYLASHVENQGHTIDSDTLYYDETREYGRAWGHVTIVDSDNGLTCTGRYGETSQADGFSFVTDSAHVLFVDNGDTLFLHADTVYVTTDSTDRLQTVRANYHVKVYRRDAQAMCDSAFYSAPDSTLLLYKEPVLWYEHYQCVADTIELLHDTAGVRRAWLRTNCFAVQQVDRDKFNQLKGHQGRVYFRDGEPDYADVLGNAQMVFYITEEDTSGRNTLVGVNAGMGTDIRIYFDTTRAPVRVVTFDKPDMKTYPVGVLPEELKRLPDFRWLSSRRPRKPEDVFVW